MRLAIPAALTAVALLAGCSDKPRSEPLAGGNETCVGSFLMGSVQRSANACTACGNAEEQLAIDGVRDSYGYAYQAGGTYTLRAIAPNGVLFPAGNFAGALMRIPTAYSPGTTWTISSLRGGAVQESRTPANADGDDPAIPSGADDYYGFITSMDFDAVEFTVTGGSSDAVNLADDPVRFYEFCGQR